MAVVEPRESCHMKEAKQACYEKKVSRLLKRETQEGTSTGDNVMSNYISLHEETPLAPLLP